MYNKMSGRGVTRRRNNANNENERNRAGKRRGLEGGRRANVHVNRRAAANVPTRRNWPLNLADPVSLNSLANWTGNRAIEVNHPTNPAIKTYFTTNAFRQMFGNNWKNMPPTSNVPIHPIETHPVTRQLVPRRTVRLVYFQGPKPVVV
jgi:hypothetical protein